MNISRQRATRQLNVPIMFSFRFELKSLPDRRSARQRRRIGLARRLGDQPVAGVSMRGLDARAELGARQARRAAVEDLDDDRAGIAHEAAARPEQAGVERQRHAGQRQALIERDVARLVVGRRARAVRVPSGKITTSRPCAGALRASRISVFSALGPLSRLTKMCSNLRRTSRRTGSARARPSSPWPGRGRPGSARRCPRPTGAWRRPGRRLAAASRGRAPRAACRRSLSSQSDTAAVQPRGPPSPSGAARAAARASTRKARC